MRTAFLALCFAMSTAPAAMAQDDSPLFGSEGSGVIQISITDKKADQHVQASLSEDLTCASQGCSHMQKTAMRGADTGTQP